MTNDEFETLVARLEQEAERNPSGYKRNVILLALLGNVYLWAMVLLVVVALVLSLYSLKLSVALGIKLVIVVAPIAFLVLRALFVSIPKPNEGLEVDAEDTPELFAMIKELRTALKAPKFHHVYVTDDLNAAVAQYPRFGPFGTVNYLIVGLPLMQALSVDEFKAVLAHEFGHLSKGHGRLSHWIYRQRLRWQRILYALEDSQSAADFLFRPFMNWYSPYFQAYSFPLARADEYEADAVAAELTSKQNTAQALVNIEVIAGFYGEKFWSSIFKSAKTDAKPKVRPYQQFTEVVHSEIDTTSADKWLAQALGRTTQTDDTHPALSDRINALRVRELDFKPCEPSQVASQLLGDSLPILVEHFDDEWRGQVAKSWREYHESMQQAQTEYDALVERLKAGEKLKADDACSYLRLAERLETMPAEKILVQLKRMNQAFPEHADASYMLGRCLLDEKDDTGIAYIERAMHLDSDYKPYGAELLRDYFWKAGFEQKAEYWHGEYVKHMEAAHEAYQEQNQISVDDNFMPHEMDDDALTVLRAKVKNISVVKHAFLVSMLSRDGESRRELICFRAIGAMEMFSNRKIEQAYSELHDAVAFLTNKYNMLVICIDGDEDVFYNKMKKIKRSKLK